MTLPQFRFVLAAALASSFFDAATVPSPAGNAAKLHWMCSTEANPWTSKPDVAVAANVSVPTQPRALVLVDSTRREQAIDGWGGCFNERGWKALESLTAAQRDEVIRNLFDAKSGLNLGICRTPFGASDYAITLYSLDETPGDYAMEHFSIDRDRERLIPYIKAALAVRPDMTLWAVPWSPPSWMKDNNNLIAGNIRDDDRTLDALALYFVRYIQAYRAAGVTVSMVMPQNEPNISSKYTSCLWTGEQLAKFIGRHLGPAFEREHVRAQIFLGTLNDSKRGGYAYWVGPSLEDPVVRKYLAGVGCQWDADTTMAETHFLRPTVKLIQTEAECGKTNTNGWAFAEYQYQLARKWFGCGASINTIWNLVLDETGLSTANWAQCSPVVIDTKQARVIYTPYYYCYKHFAHFVQPGAHVLRTESSWKDRVAFVNASGEVVVVMNNASEKAETIALNVDGRQSDVVELPPHSFNTFTLER